MPTLFEKIIAGEIPADIVYEDEHVVAFRDIEPAAPVHVLVVPRRPLPHLEAAGRDDAKLLGHLFLGARAVAEREDLTEKGYRLVLNNGRDAGQEVPHLHLHVVGGRGFGWPPG